MRKVYYFVLCAFFLSAAIPAQTLYLVTNQELNRLEAIWKNSEANRLTWESQVSGLRVKAETLQKNSENLNSLLSLERSTVSSLQRSFNAYALDQSRINSAKDLKISTLETDNERTKGQRNTLFFGLSGMLALAIFQLFMRIRKVFGFP